MSHFTLIAITVTLFFLLTSLWGFYISIRPPKITSSITPQDFGLAYEDISFITQDGLTIHGWFIPQGGSGQVPRQNHKKIVGAKTIILLHGYPADKGDILPSLIFLHEKYNLLLFDFRYLGASQGKYSTAGAKEPEDLLAAVRFLKSRGIETVGVWGFSAGGAVAFMAAPRAPEIQVIVSESSYARLSLLTRQLYRLPGLNYPLGYLTGLWAKVLLGIDIKDVSPANSAQQLTLPVLVIHSTTDEVIPFEHALILKDALKNNPQAEFWFQDNISHGQLQGEYQKRVKDFFDNNL